MKASMCEAWKITTGLPAYQGDLFAVETDAVVSPANSFGFMDGGVDWRITQFLGPSIQEILQAWLRSQPIPELPVGMAVSIDTEHPVWKYVIAAPTMRVPRLITDPRDIYIAARAATVTAKNLGLDSLTFPGMGTGCGNIAPMVAAKMMYEGILHAFDPPPFPETIREAVVNHQVVH